MKTYIRSFIFYVGICIAAGAGNAAGQIAKHQVDHSTIMPVHPEAYNLDFNHWRAGWPLMSHGRY